MAEFKKGEIEFRGAAPYPLPIVQYARAYAEGTTLVVEASMLVQGRLQVVLIPFSLEAAAQAASHIQKVLGA